MGGVIQLFQKALGQFLGFLYLPGAVFQHPHRPGSQLALPQGHRLQEQRALLLWNHLEPQPLGLPVLWEPSELGLEPAVLDPLVILQNSQLQWGIGKQLGRAETEERIPAPAGLQVAQIFPVFSVQ